MNLQDNAQLILALIKADMCHHKLIIGLEKAGLSIPDLYGDLDIQILKLMGFSDEKRDDEMHEFYYAILEKLISEVSVEEFRGLLERLAEEMLGALKSKKNGDWEIMAIP